MAISAVIGGLEACHGQIDAEREFPCRDWDREERQTPPKIIGVGAGAEDVVRICPEAWIRASAGDHEEPSQVPNTSSPALNCVTFGRLPRLCLRHAPAMITPPY